MIKTRIFHLKVVKLAFVGFVGACFLFLICWVYYLIAHKADSGGASNQIFFDGININIASSAVWIAITSIAGLGTVLLLQWLWPRKPKVEPDPAIIRAIGVLDFDSLSLRLDKSNEGDRFILIKNWICSNGDALNEKFKKALFEAISRGVAVYIFLLHPRSPSAFRRFRQIGTDVSEKVLKSVSALQQAYKENAGGLGKGSLRVFCHDIFSGFELFLHENTEKLEGWAQFALYSGAGIASDCQQMIVERPHPLAEELSKWTHNLVNQFTTNEFKNFDFTEIMLAQLEELERIKSRPLLIQAHDVPRALRGVPNGVFRKFVADICMQEAGLPPDADVSSTPFNKIIDELYLQGIGTDAVAKAVGILSISRNHNVEMIERLLRDTRDGGEFVVLDNWFGGDYGLKVPAIKNALSGALKRGVLVKFILLHPNSILADRRLAEIHTELQSVRRAIMESMEEISFWVKNWEDRHNERANVELFCHDCVSSLQIFAGTATFSLGFYLKNIPASEGTQILVSRDGTLGEAISKHMDYVGSQSGRLTPVKLREPIAPQFDGKLSSVQIAEVAELLCNSSPASAHTVANLVVTHACSGPSADGPDRHKVDKATPPNFDARKLALKSFALALLDSLPKSGLALTKLELAELKGVLKSSVGDLPEALGIQGADARDLRRILKKLRP